MSVSVTDPDNENSATNDDNEITVTYGSPLDENGIWHTGYKDAGQYTISITASDGEVTVSEDVMLNVTNSLPFEVCQNPDINWEPGKCDPCEPRWCGDCMNSTTKMNCHDSTALAILAEWDA